MSHRTVSTTARILAAVLVAAIGVSAAVQAGSQEAPLTPERHDPRALPGGTVVLHLRAEHAGETVLSIQVRSVRKTLALSGDTAIPRNAVLSWRLNLGLETMNRPNLIRCDLYAAHLQRRGAGRSLDISFQAGAVLTYGEEKTLFSSDDVTFRVRAVFEREGT